MSRQNFAKPSHVWRTGVRIIGALIWVVAISLFWLNGIRKGFDVSLILFALLASYFLTWAMAFSLSSRDSAMTLRFVLTTASLCFAVGCLELLAATGLVDYRLVFSTPMEPWSNPANVLDPELLHIHKPHQRYTGTSRGDIARSWNLSSARVYQYDLRYDHNGFRNDVDLAAADVAVVGDSLVEAGNVATNDLMTTVLADRLGCTVANLGQAWYGPQQELAVLERYACHLHPKICVWAFFEGNDLEDIHRYNKATDDWQTFSKSLQPFRARCFTRTFLLAACGAIQNGKPSHRIRTQYGTVRAKGESTRLYFSYAGKPLDSGDILAIRQLKSILTSAYERCSANGSRLMVVFLPIKFRVYNGICEFPRNSACTQWEITDLPGRVRSIVSETSGDIEYLDLTPVFRQKATDGVMLYYPDDTHWSPEGHKVAGEFICQYAIQKLNAFGSRAAGTTSP